LSSSSPSASARITSNRSRCTFPLRQPSALCSL
jgi:hypothetical protein